MLVGVAYFVWLRRPERITSGALWPISRPASLVATLLVLRQRCVWNEAAAVDGK